MSEAKNTALGRSARFGYSRGVTNAPHNPMITIVLILIGLVLVTGLDSAETAHRE
ncbi:MAG TPA: hypothetical protein VHV47_04605 [Opitutaceae bacterium]|jgi:hypothetical protein|nr:hypothetical protein [Opitutaceae bacterium]